MQEGTLAFGLQRRLPRELSSTRVCVYACACVCVCVYVCVSCVLQLCKSNDYVTTIHGINSCVLKLSKLTKAAKVWRGIKDARLPPEFWAPNEMGVRGGIEYGFSSTTTDRAQALHYAQGMNPNDGDAMTIFEMQMGMVDRGADLSWLSQYPHEREVLLPPLTGIEALDTNVEGGMLVINARLSLNMAALTLEQVLSRRRKMLMDMAEGIELELRDAAKTNSTIAALAKKERDAHTQFTVRLLKAALHYGPLDSSLYSVEWFNDDNNFADAMSQVLYLQKAINLEAPRLLAALDKAELPFKNLCVGNPARVLLLAGWVLCRPRHLDTAIDLRDSQIKTDEGRALAELMARHPRLTSIDVRGNETLGEAGVAALGQVLRHTHAMEVVQQVSAVRAPRSLCGVNTIKPTLDVPRTMTAVDAALITTELECSNFAEGQVRIPPQTFHDLPNCAC